MPKYSFDEIAMNSTEKKKPTEGDKDTYIGLEHLDSGSLEVTRWGADVAPVGDKLVMKKGDVLFGRRRAYQKKVAIAPFDGIFSAHGMVLRPIEAVVAREFFPFFISSDSFLDAAIQISVGSLSPTINWRDLCKLEFEIPTIEEQKELAPILWGMNRLKVAYTRLLQQMDTLVQSQFVEMFKFIPEADYVPLQSVCRLITDGTHNPPKFVNQGIPFLLVSNITGNKVTFDTEKYITEETYTELMKRTPVEKGDILLSTVGSYGHPAIVESDQRFSFQRHIAHLKPNHLLIDSHFLHSAILSTKVQQQIDVLVLGVAQKTLNLSAIKSIKIPLPTMAEQEDYNRFVQATDKSKFACEKQEKMLDVAIKTTISARNMIQSD